MTISRSVRNIRGAFAIVLAFPFWTEISRADTEEIIHMSPVYVTASSGSWAIPVEYRWTAVWVAPVVHFMPPTFTIGPGGLDGSGNYAGATSPPQTSPDGKPLAVQVDTCLKMLQEYVDSLKLTAQQVLEYANANAAPVVSGAFKDGVSAGMVMQYVDTIPGMNKPGMAGFHGLVQAGADEMAGRMFMADLGTVAKVVLSMANSMRMASLAVYQTTQIDNCQNGAQFQMQR